MDYLTAAALLSDRLLLPLAFSNPFFTVAWILLKQTSDHDIPYINLPWP